MDFIKFFDNEKRELSSQSNSGDGPKRFCTEVDSFLDDSVNDEVFTEGLQSPQCVKILIKCLRNLESQVEELHSISNATKEKQIKGDGHLADLKKSFEFISTKFEVYEKERKEKEEAINLLKAEVASVKKKKMKIWKNDLMIRINALMIKSSTQEVIVYCCMV